MTTLVHTLTTYQRDDRTCYRDSNKTLADYCVVIKRGDSIVLLLHGDAGKHYEVKLDQRTVKSIAHLIPQLTEVEEEEEVIVLGE